MEIEIKYEIKEEGNIRIFGKIKLNEINVKGMEKLTDMRYIFYGYSSLCSLPDISKWNTFNVKDMSSMFYGCSSLSSLPDKYIV